MIGKCTKCYIVYEWDPKSPLPRRLVDAVCRECLTPLVRTTYLCQLPRATRPPTVDHRRRRSVRKFKQGQTVWFRGKYSNQFSIKGTVEAVDPHRPPGIYGIRLVNGNFIWAAESQLREEKRGPGP